MKRPCLDGRRRRRAPLIVVVALLGAGIADARAGAGQPSVALTVSSQTITIGDGVEVAGIAAGPSAAGATVELQVSPYPYKGFVTVARASATPAGSFTFPAVHPDRNARLRVALTGTSVISSTSGVTVDPKVSLTARPLAPGRVQLELRLRHTSHAGNGPVSVWWYVAPRAGRRFSLAAVSPAHDSSPQLITASATVDPPSAGFTYRVCLNPVWERAMGAAAAHGACPHHDFTLGAGGRAASCPTRCLRGFADLEYEGRAHGTPRAAFPSRSAIAAASSFLASRAGTTAFAVVTSAGRLVGLRTHQRFETASIVKVMFLVAYLQMLERRHRGLQAADRALLYPMIHVSDNNAASAVLAHVGQAAVRRVARESGMSAYRPGIGWWAFSQTDAADQARLFSELSQLIPHRFYAYARGLLAGIEPSQSWGFPPVARPAWQIFYKTGALPSRGLFGEGALLERPGVSFAVAVLTDGDPSMLYGEQTIEGVAQRLLAGAP